MLIFHIIKHKLSINAKLTFAEKEEYKTENVEV